MTNIDEWLKTCLHKKKYSEATADELIGRIKKERGVILRKYSCPHCFGWHLTKKAKS